MVHSSSAAAETLAIFGAIFWSTQLIPQIYLNHKRRTTNGLSITMMLLWAAAGVVLGIYNIAANLSIALWVQAQILTALSLICIFQCFYHDRDKSIVYCLSLGTSTMILFAGIEVAGVLGLKQLKEGIIWPVRIFAVLAAAILALGVAKELWTIIRMQSVKGFSVIFAILDAAGDLTSLLSLFFLKTLDVYAVVIYGLELALWIVFLLAYLVIWHKTREKQ